jgi:ATP/maltotriose-dependent transcriptional regulator MalT
MTIDPWRVAQIVVDRGPGNKGSRGSGYLIGPGRVLTAAHVLAGASVVRVRLDVGQKSEIDVQADSWWADPAGRQGTDLAVITIPPTATAGRTVESVRFGRISDCAAMLTVQAFGFPLFKLKAVSASVGQGKLLRDFEQVSGHAPVAANRSTGTLAVNLDDPPPKQPPEGEPSPWQGMSGGAVWSDDRIVAVVAEHHPSEGTGRLTARRIDRAYEKLSTTDLRELGELLRLPAIARGLHDVVPVEQDQRVRSAYLAQVGDIAPLELIGRDDELAEWVEFCAGTAPYAWWQAGPWAGKSALASWFVVHPPVGVDVVSFFITGRFLGQADSDEFLDAMIEQLNSLYPAGVKSPPVAGARVGAWWELVASAAAEAEEQGRRLVVVVDGLDEDAAGAAPAAGRPSIASLLPRRPSSGVRFIVTSRGDPGLPDDVPVNHPLRTCRPRRLTVSLVAEGIALSAKQELAKLLAGDQVAIDVVGYVAGSGGGLTRSDLSALTGAPPLKLDPVLRGVFGRSLHTRTSADSRNPQADPATRVYLFAHETLRITAEEQLGSDLVRYREKVHEWIGFYADAGWPDSTPGYAIRGYQRLLVATADLTRLCALVRDPRRHAFLSEATGSDYAALAEIGTAQSLIADQKVPDLKALVELAAYRLAIALRNESIPDELPVTWAQLARFSHAEALAHSLSTAKAQARALTRMAIVAAEAGDLARANRLAADAETLTRTLINRRDQAEVLTGLVPAIAGAGDLDHASRLAADTETLARTLTDPYPQAQVLIGLVTAIAKAGDQDRAEALARTLTDRDAQVETLSSLATLAADAGEMDRATRLAADAETLTGPFTEDSVLIGLVTAIAKTGDLDRAEALARTHPDVQARALTGLATVAAETGHLNRASRLAADAETLARTLTDRTQALVLIDLMTVAAKTGDLNRANRLTVAAETLARTFTDVYLQASVLTGLVTAIAKAGDPDRAEALARTITDRYIQADSLTGLAAIAIGTGDLDRANQLATDAETLARTFTSREDQAELLSGLATAAANAGDLDRAKQLAADAETVARTLTDPNTQAQVLSQLASVAADTADLDRAHQLATDAETLARTLINRRDQTQVLAGLVTAIAKAGDLSRAEALASTLTDPDVQAQALAGLATVAAETGDLNRANRLAADTETLVGTLYSDYTQDRALASLVTAIARAGDPDRAEALANTLTEPNVQAEALAGLATVAAETGDLNRANRLAADTETLVSTLTDSYFQDRALASLVIAIAKAGDLDRAEALSRTITDPKAQARALSGLASAIAKTGDLDRATHLLAVALVTDVDTGEWIRSVSQFFPSAIGDLWNILVGAYATGT